MTSLLLERKSIVALGLTVAALAFPAPVPAQQAPESLREFGFRALDLDEATVRQLAPHSTLVTIEAGHPRFTELVPYARARGLRVIVQLGSMLFEAIPRPGGGPFLQRLRADAEDRFLAFVDRNQTVISPGSVWAFFVADEPYWRQVPAADLERAHGLVTAAFPLIPTMSSLNIHDLEMAPETPPELFDIVAFHMYAVPGEPATDPDYRRGLELLQRKFPGRDYAIVADAWWAANRHGAVGIAPADLAAKAEQYREVAEEIGAVALGGFSWDSFPGGTGLRDLPEPAIRAYARVGAELTGKCGIPDDVPALAGERLLFLHDCRFHVTLRWRNPAIGEEGHAVAVAHTRDSGAFWFFRPGNLELTVKILDGRQANGHWWVFWSDMTTLEVELEVTDAITGRTRVYTRAASDTTAFAD